MHRKYGKDVLGALTFRHPENGSPNVAYGKPSGLLRCKHRTSTKAWLVSQVSLRCSLADGNLDSKPSGAAFGQAPGKYRNVGLANQVRGGGPLPDVTSTQPDG